MLKYFANTALKFCSPSLPVSTFGRNITYLRQKYPERVPCYVTLNGGTQEITVEQQIYIEGEKEKENPVIEVLLSDSVPGLGAKGSLVKIHRNRFWNNLYLRKLAELPTPERIRQLQSEHSSVLFGHSYEVQQRLLNMTLYIPMNPNIDWTLSPKHVMVAFRRVGVIVPEEGITLPDKPVTSSTLEEFPVNVNIENKVTVPVKSRIFLYQRLDAKTTTKPPADSFRKIRLDDWTLDFSEDDLRLLPGFTNKPYRN
ncbi:unnamed protein product [Hymenolepis diminuta]|uniref:Large ribosomal subunit protein bL9m n=2 Tax=Hymenolepis diminuta TaxID=6216 RepID=A0A564Y8C9_HYMDI|nr:unnamed protein product [Hymenolepis diminuta]